ncbi:MULTISPECIES: hypothetical protein [Legionella]|uniref:Uncharacterized protein n=1 Tax=Legionella maceachernii TaxID=466 RepID=A0A0W0WHM8_9GAMM|nr:hypothetical protein [Legionella maceachernii]KTD31808.1 hypothetical protein Lmac_0112 [Legionella maceachernii]SJZ98093.1 hypothetical protein SAMN02745128_01640 [Legionella maceachernii]SUP01124.1 Uncharacterised protein [Legionella maceachernii]
MFLKYIVDLEILIQEARKKYSERQLTKANEVLKNVFGLLNQQDYYTDEIEIDSLRGSGQYAKRLSLVIHDYCDLINKIYFTQTYGLLKDCNRLISEGNLAQAGVLLNTVKKQANKLYQFYVNALQSGLESAPAYIDFPQALYYLKHHIRESEEHHSQVFAKKVCNNFMNFAANQSALGLDLSFRAQSTNGRNRYCQFSPASVPFSESFVEDLVDQTEFGMN